MKFRFLLVACALLAVVGDASAFGRRCRSSGCAPASAPQSYTYAAPSCCGSACPVGSCGTAGECGVNGCAPQAYYPQYAPRYAPTYSPAVQSYCPGGNCAIPQAPRSFPFPVK